MKQLPKHLISLAVLAMLLFLAYASTDTDTDKVSGSTKEGTLEEGTEHASEKEKKRPTLEIIKHSSKYEPMMQSYTVYCRVRNNSDRLISVFMLKATFYDKEGNIVGTGNGGGSNIAAGEEKTVEVMGIGIQNAANYDVKIDTML